MNQTTHEQLLQAQFSPQANAYLHSEVHAKGDDLQLVRQLVGEQPQARVLDMGCGGGHVSFQLAEQVKEIVAFDLSNAMLQVVRTEAQKRCLTNLQTCQGNVASLPFADDHFDVVITRYSAHHWTQWSTALSEMRRVLKPSGQVMIIDVISSDEPLLDSWLQTIETIRDPSHVRDFTLSQWLQALTQQGFKLQSCQQFPLFLEFQSWIERMQPPAEHVATIRSLIQKAPNSVRDFYEINAKDSFTLQSALIVAS
ncbi:class I SAM-dependent methyltransferase [Celerinatantimonas yamalensis]|uniref:Class I SAM-dependent methyltransferase n=1 Tax=Celerinatantimonas yamalensis TaxID=559956 RepID=A0ABW9G655_9GAMM